MCTGSQLVRLTWDTTCMDVDPAWSPDGPTNACTSCGDDPVGYSHIHVMAADGTGAKALTAGPATENSPTWSPDGHQIAFQRGTGNEADVRVMSADGSGATNLTANNAGVDRYPRWRRRRVPRRGEQQHGSKVAAARQAVARSVRQPLAVSRRPPRGANDGY